MSDMTTFVARERKTVHIYHVEAPGCIVNIYTGLRDSEGRKVTRVDISPDRCTGEEWHIADGAPCGIRVIEGKEDTNA